MAKQKKPKQRRSKKINYEIIEQYEDKRSKTLSDPYRHLEAMLPNHPHLNEARIAMAWRKGLKQDQDGLMVLGKCKKCTDLDREFRPFDFIIILNREMWGKLSEQQRAALVDHELEHAGVAKDKDGEPKRDEKGRLVYRYRKHDLEEFRSIIERHGVYKADIEAFARTCIEQQHTPLFPDASEPGAVAGTINPQEAAS